MIADQDVHPATGRSGLFFETHEQIHRIARVGSSIKQVTDDYEVAVAARPTEGVVDNTGMLQCFFKRLVCTVNIAKCDDAFDIAELPLLGSNWLQCRNQGERQSAHFCKPDHQIM